MEHRDELTGAFVAASRALIGIAVHSVSTAPVEITVAQFRFLVLVAEGTRTIGDVADLLGVNQSNASRFCDRLQKLGLVERLRVEDDARVVRIGLTSAGTELIDVVMRQRRDDVRAVLDRLTPEDAAAALQALRAFNLAAEELDADQLSRMLWSI